ncbi:MAG: flagellar hook-associated protein FlgL [Cellvibrionaceae bacterium]|nr:flagellar hook-associated protein FlgL [Cellvibrionaceae bacterium]
MRISTSHIFNLANHSMADANQAIIKTQEQLSTGKKVLSAADDPVAASRIQQLHNNLAQIEQYNKNITLAENNLSLEEATLNSANNLVQRLEELAVQAANTGVLSSSEYAAIASEVSARLDELFNLTNTRNANGDYIFSGYKSHAPGFVGDISNGYRFVGDDGQMAIKIDNNTKIAASDSGKAMFVDIPSATYHVTTAVDASNRSNPPLTITVGEITDQAAYDQFYPEDIVITFNEDTAVVPTRKNFTVTERSTGKIIEANHLYTSGEALSYHGVSVRIFGSPASADTGAGLAGDQLFINSSNTQDVLNTVRRFHDAMIAYDGSVQTREQLQTVVASTITTLSSAQEVISETVTKIGARNNTLESTKDLHLDAQLVSQEILSQLSDIDYAEAASRLSAQTLILQAAQASFLTISELSLFSRL